MRSRNTRAFLDITFVPLLTFLKLKIARKSVVANPAGATDYCRRKQDDAGNRDSIESYILLLSTKYSVMNRMGTLKTPAVCGMVV